VTEAFAFLDVNVPMCAAGQPHPYRDACAWLMTEVANGRLAVAIDVEIIQEILYRFGALRRWDIAVTMAFSLLELVPMVYPIRLVESHLSIDLFEHYAQKGVTARDVLHVAVMQQNNLDQIISTDEHFDAFAGITRLDPLQLFTQANRS